MLELVNKKIKVIESLIGIYNDKKITALNNKDYDNAFYYGGLVQGFKLVLGDLKEIRDKLEMDVSFVDHALDGLRG